MASFITVAGIAESLYKEKGSRFIGLAYPVQSEAEIKKILDELKKLHYKARHICYAYRLGSAGNIVRSSDAGEPANSAGPPMLNQIMQRELTNTLVVVVRYFGGTKLGVGGLVNAYKTAAAEALDSAGFVEDFEKEKIEIETDYEGIAEVMNLIKTKNVRILQEEYGQVCRMAVEVPKEEVQKMRSLFAALKKVRITG